MVPSSLDTEIAQIVARAQELLTRYGSSTEAELPPIRQSLLSFIQKMVARAKQCFSQGQLDQALKLNKVILSASRILESRGGEGVTLYNMGLIYQKMEQPQDALDCFLQARRIEREQGDLKSQVASTKRIAECYLKLGQPEVALEYLEQLKAIQIQFGDKAGENATQEIIDIINEEMGK
jgi:tetratricopeptide (TPR) repeat protein